MEYPKEILSDAIAEYNPVDVLLLFSGGHDSLVSTHIAASWLTDQGISFKVYHGDTTIGIPETQDYVREVCEKYGWQLVIRQPPNREEWYDKIVEEYGFPGSTKSSHRIMYRRLKERAIRKYVTHECKSSPFARENVLLVTGIRKSESKIRMGYIHPTQKEDSRVWTNPIFYYSEKACKRYMADNDLPENPVKKAICISGECLCGSFGSREELAEIKAAYPHVYERIQQLHEVAKANGHPWDWGSGPNEWYKNHPPGQLNMFMCVGCENKREKTLSNNTI